MSDQKQPTNRSLPPDFPPELVEPLTALFKMRQHINIKVLPREAWIIVGLVQFADRNPNLEPQYHEMLRWFGDQIIEGLVNINPVLEDYLAMGWDPKYDGPMPKKEKE